MDFLKEGNLIIVTVPVSEGHPERTLVPELTKKYGKNFDVLNPEQHLETYANAYALIRKKLRDGEALTLLNRNKAQVTFYTPKRKVTAWSAWIRVVDIQRFLYN
jgi:hypothetical protein